jgi:hypothetical protein
MTLLEQHAALGSHQIPRDVRKDLAALREFNGKPTRRKTKFPKLPELEENGWIVNGTRSEAERKRTGPGALRTEARGVNCAI